MNVYACPLYFGVITAHITKIDTLKNKNTHNSFGIIDEMARRTGIEPVTFSFGN